MQMIPLMFITLFSAFLLSGCCSTPETKAQANYQTGVQTKGQIITRCLDDQSPEQCDKKYNP